MDNLLPPSPRVTNKLKAQRCLSATQQLEIYLGIGSFMQFSRLKGNRGTINYRSLRVRLQHLPPFELRRYESQIFRCCRRSTT